MRILWLLCAETTCAPAPCLRSFFERNRFWSASETAFPIRSMRKSLQVAGSGHPRRSIPTAVNAAFQPFWAGTPMSAMGRGSWSAYTRRMTGFADFPPVRKRTPMSVMGILQSPCRPSQSGRSTPHCGHQPGFRPLLHRSSRGLGEERTFRFRLATVKKGCKRLLR
jgi:hypothetical protein